MTIEIGFTDNVFSLSEARELLPLVQTLTSKHQAELEPVQLKLQKMLSNDPRRKVVEKEFSSIVLRWRTKLEQLGVVVVDLWLVGFDVGEGLLSWRHPELAISHFVSHGSLQERVKLSNYIDEVDPDWAR